MKKKIYEFFNPLPPNGFPWTHVAKILFLN